jgi:hypothetical protein
VMMMLTIGRSSLTGRISTRSTAGLAVVSTTGLPVAQLYEGVGRRQPQLGREWGVVGAPVGKHCRQAGSRSGCWIGLGHPMRVRRKRSPVDPSS